VVETLRHDAGRQVYIPHPQSDGMVQRRRLKDDLWKERSHQLRSLHVHTWKYKRYVPPCFTMRVPLESCAVLKFLLYLSSDLHSSTSQMPWIGRCSSVIFKEVSKIVNRKEINV
jgi:hypothetical protein